MAEQGSPYVPHGQSDRDAMLDAVGAEAVSELFDIPPSVRFDGDLGIEGQSERAVQADIAETLGKNQELASFLGRGHYDHYVPSLVDHLADRSEFLTSYTQYQPEITQGFLQVLFEYQSLLAELTGLEVANASMYDHATALGEAALLAARVRETDGDRVLVPETVRDERLEVLENYGSGSGLVIEEYASVDGNADVDALRSRLGPDVTMVYVESPNALGAIEEAVPAIADLAAEHDALSVLGSDPVALSLLEEPAEMGVDVVVGDAASLGMGTAFGMGLGLFACRESFLRQVPGRLVGASEDTEGRRAFTLTLQTREQHIRREQATSNICTNQAWVALRAAIHAAWLGPDGLVELATDCVRQPEDLADRLDDHDRIEAPAHDRHHFREFVARVDRSAESVAAALAREGYLVHALDDDELQICVTNTTESELEEFATALEGVA